MGRCLLVGSSLLGVQLLASCASKGSFNADAERCRSQTTASSQPPAGVFRLPEAVDEDIAERVTPHPKETSAYVLCMRSLGWKMDPSAGAQGKGLSAGEYSQLLAEDLTICVSGGGDESPRPPSSEAVSSSAARVVCACLKGKAAPGITSVDLGLVIGEGGRIRRVTAEPESPVAACLRESLPEAEVAEPPSAPWKATVRILHYQ
jgi:hypothetical protein